MRITLETVTITTAGGAGVSTGTMDVAFNSGYIIGIFIPTSLPATIDFSFSDLADVDQVLFSTSNDNADDWICPIVPIKTLAGVAIADAGMPVGIVSGLRILVTGANVGTVTLKIKVQRLD